MVQHDGGDVARADDDPGGSGVETVDGVGHARHEIRDRELAEPSEPDDERKEPDDRRAKGAAALCAIGRDGLSRPQIVLRCRAIEQEEHGGAEQCHR